MTVTANEWIALSPRSGNVTHTPASHGGWLAFGVPALPLVKKVSSIGKWLVFISCKMAPMLTQETSTALATNQQQYKAVKDGTASQSGKHQSGQSVQQTVAKGSKKEQWHVQILKENVMQPPGQEMRKNVRITQAVMNGKQAIGLSAPQPVGRASSHVLCSACTKSPGAMAVSVLSCPSQQPTGSATKRSAMRRLMSTQLPRPDLLLSRTSAQATSGQCTAGWSGRRTCAKTCGGINAVARLAETFMQTRCNRRVNEPVLLLRVLQLFVCKSRTSRSEYWNFMSCYSVVDSKAYLLRLEN